MKEIIIVGIGGFVGSVARFKTAGIFFHQLKDSQFPWATFAVNVMGCLLVGLIAGLLERISFYNAEMRLLLITGFLGGFTTFSAFGLETFYLIRTGHTALALINVFASVAVGLFAVWAGLRLAA